ncbi:MAG: acyl-CoA dehydrogenase family protein [Mycobacterium sp.]|nr:acyl-CoA dehydrogenase family protein [Mycobacterium sp.]
MRRDLFTEDHEAFRELARDFVEKEVVPDYPLWEKGGRMPREVFQKMGSLGMLGMAIPEEYGGGGEPDYRYNVVLQEEAARALVTLSTVRTQLEVILPYFLHYANAEQRERWFPGLAAGTLLTAIAMTEPAAGSDLAGIKTTARQEGSDWILNGSKTFITNGSQADLIVVVVKTNTSEGAKGISLVLVEGDRPGFRRGRVLDKIGQRGQDTSELFFDGVRVPTSNLLGAEEGQGFIQLMQQLPQERLIIAVASIAGMEAAIDHTLSYTKERQAFGRPVFGFQNTKFKLAEAATETRIGRVFVDDCIVKHLDGQLDIPTVAMAKWWTTDRAMTVLDECVQLFGGYGYMNEYPIARMWADNRVQKIYAGTNEIMKEIIARSL